MDLPAEEIKEPAPRRKGCLFWAFLLAFLVVAIVAAGLGLTAYSWVHRYTSTSPAPVPRYEPKPGEARAVEQKLAEFGDSAEAGAPRKLVLTAGDLNALVAASRHGDRWAGKVFFRLEGDKAFADISLPLDEVPLLSGRYLNGTVELEVGLEAGDADSKDPKKDKVELKKGGLVATVVGATAGGKPLPSELILILKERNLLERISGEAFLEFAKSAKVVEIRDGKLILER